MFPHLFTLKRSRSVWSPIIGAVVVVVAVIMGGLGIWRPENEESVRHVADASAVDTSPMGREQAFALLDHQRRELSAIVGESGVVRLSNAGEIVVDGNGHAWISTSGDDIGGVAVTSRRADVLALYEAQITELRNSLGDRGLQRLLATGEAE